MRGRQRSSCHQTNGKIVIRQSMSECWLLLRLLPPLLGEFVYEGNPEYGVLLEPCRLVERIFASKFTRNDVFYLRWLIGTWLKEFKEVFPSVPLKPKFHFLIHYPAAILRFGPPRCYWTIRHEGNPVKKSPQHMQVYRREASEVTGTKTQL